MYSVIQIENLVVDLGRFYRRSWELGHHLQIRCVVRRGKPKRINESHRQSDIHASREEYHNIVLSAYEDARSRISKDKYKAFR
jgi:hypothetical protein